MILDALKPKIEDIVNRDFATKEDYLQNICQLLETEVPYYNWVGFYFKNGNKNELKLSSYVGEPTDHTIIPFGKGICGQVAVSNENFAPAIN